MVLQLKDMLARGLGELDLVLRDGEPGELQKPGNPVGLKDQGFLVEFERTSFIVGPLCKHWHIPRKFRHRR